MSVCRVMMLIFIVATRWVLLGFFFATGGQIDHIFQGHLVGGLQVTAADREADGFLDRDRQFNDIVLGDRDGVPRKGSG